MKLFLYAFVFSRARFLYASSTVLLLLIGFELGEVYITKRDMLSLINSDFYLFSAVIIGFIAAYMIEFFMRRNLSIVLVNI